MAELAAGASQPQRSMSSTGNCRTAFAALQDRRRGSAIVGGQQGEPFKQQVKVSTVVVRSGTAKRRTTAFWPPIAKASNPINIRRAGESATPVVFAITDATRTDARLNRRGSSQ